MIFRILFTLGLVLAIDLYAYQAFRTVFKSSATPWIYWGITLAYVVVSLIVTALMLNGKVESASSSANQPVTLPSSVGM